MNITGHTQVFGLLGHPVRHSLSPAMHTRLFTALGVDAVYVAFDVHPDTTGERLVDAIRTLDVRGVNLTVPFKSRLVPHLDHVTEAAREADAVNVVIQHGGELTGYNTDGEGFCRSLEEDWRPELDGVTAAILGTGGAGRAIAASLADRGASQVLLLNRTESHARTAQRCLRARYPDVDWRTGPLTRRHFASVAPGLDLAVVCTSGAADSLLRSLDPLALPAHAAWCDINYWQTDPPHSATLRASGRAFVDGLGMLIHQGALSFELFTGLPVDPSRIRQQLPTSSKSDPPV